MSEPTWLNGYTGQTVDELIALEKSYRIGSVLLAFEQALGKKAARDGAQSLTVEERTLLAIESLEREVNNGGYHQFFFNTPEHGPIIVDALRRIGCLKTAEITQRAVSALKLPEVTVEAIQEIINDNDDLIEILDEYDTEFYKYPDKIAEKLFEYVKANRGQFSF